MLRIPIGINTLVEVGIPFTQEPEEITAPACTNEVVIFVLLMCNKKNGKMKTQQLPKSAVQKPTYGEQVTTFAQKKCQLQKT